MHTAPLTREHPQGSILVLDQGKEVVVESAELLARLGVDGIIRIRESEYSGINKELGYLGHFNLETAGHIVRAQYALPRIIRSGFFDTRTGEEQQPLLSFDNTLTAVCMRCDERLSYDALTPKYFQYPLKHVSDVGALKQVILERYTKSVHGVSEGELLMRGVAYTLLRFA